MIYHMDHFLQSVHVSYFLVNQEIFDEKRGRCGTWMDLLVVEGYVGEYLLHLSFVFGCRHPL